MSDRGFHDEYSYLSKGARGREESESDREKYALYVCVEFMGMGVSENRYQVANFKHAHILDDRKQLVLIQSKV